jgi:prepilin-type N-terminal cleavage/methylation domain-containing protein
MRSIRNSKGFTLIELMIVVVIIGILAAIAIPRFTAVSDQAKQAEAEPILKQMCTLAEAYEMREGSWPTGDPSSVVGIGWDDPEAEYYGTWTLAGTNADDGTATAAKTANANANMGTPTMDCSSKEITWATS